MTRRGVQLLIKKAKHAPENPGAWLVHSPAFLYDHIIEASLHARFSSSEQISLDVRTIAHKEPCYVDGPDQFCRKIPIPVPTFERSQS